MNGRRSERGKNGEEEGRGKNELGMERLIWEEKANEKRDGEGKGKEKTGWKDE